MFDILRAVQIQGTLDYMHRKAYILIGIACVYKRNYNHYLYDVLV